MTRKGRDCWKETTLGSIRQLDITAEEAKRKSDGTMIHRKHRRLVMFDLTRSTRDDDGE